MNKKIKTEMDFYRAKLKYDKRLDKTKKEILYSDIPDEDKALEWRQTKLPCIQCKNPVNTYFSNMHGHLVIKCGATQEPVAGYTPCSLDIDIQLKPITLIDTVITTLMKAKQLYKEHIIKTKLDYIFKYTEEEETMTNFDKYRDILEKVNQDLKQYLTILSERLAESMIKEYSVKIEEIIGEIKQHLVDKNLHDAIEMQIDILDPLLKELREVHYKYYNVEEIAKKNNISSYKLIKQQQTIKSREVPLATFDYL